MQKIRNKEYRQGFQAGYHGGSRHSDRTERILQEIIKLSESNKEDEKILRLIKKILLATKKRSGNNNLK